MTRISKGAGGERSARPIPATAHGCGRAPLQRHTCDRHKRTDGFLAAGYSKKLAKGDALNALLNLDLRSSGLVATSVPSHPEYILQRSLAIAIASNGRLNRKRGASIYIK